MRKGLTHYIACTFTFVNPSDILQLVSEDTEKDSEVAITVFHIHGAECVCMRKGLTRWIGCTLTFVNPSDTFYDYFQRLRRRVLSLCCMLVPFWGQKASVWGRDWPAAVLVDSIINPFDSHYYYFQTLQRRIVRLLWMFFLFVVQKTYKTNLRVCIIHRFIFLNPSESH